MRVGVYEKEYEYCCIYDDEEYEETYEDCKDDDIDWLGGADVFIR